MGLLSRAYSGAHVGWCGIEQENLELEVSGIRNGPSSLSGNSLESFEIRDSYSADPRIKLSAVERAVCCNKHSP